jgi:hypothetical protein
MHTSASAEAVTPVTCWRDVCKALTHSDSVSIVTGTSAAAAAVAATVASPLKTASVYSISSRTLNEASTASTLMPVAMLMRSGVSNPAGTKALAKPSYIAHDTIQSTHDGKRYDMV